MFEFLAAFQDRLFAWLDRYKQDMIATVISAASEINTKVNDAAIVWNDDEPIKEE